MESYSFNFWRNFVVDFVFGVALACYGLYASRSMVRGAGLLLAGFLAWPLLEYIVHRFVLHGPWRALRKDHTLHHGDPRMTRLTGWYAHPLTGIAVGAPIAALSSPAAAALIMSGILAGYAWFRVVHRIVHFHDDTLAPRLLGTRLSQHVRHHDQPDRLFGVTTSFWDRVFGTFRTS